MIFCVEDDSSIRDLMLYTLATAGFEAQGLPDGPAFWAAMEAQRPQLILLDIMLPGEDGVSILRKLRAAQIVLPFTGGERSLFIDNILYVESRKHKSVFYYMDTEPAAYGIYEKLDEIETRLREYEFLRIHKSYLVNPKHIRKISNYLVYLDTGEELPVPRLKYQAVKEAYTVYKGACGWT